MITDNKNLKQNVIDEAKFYTELQMGLISLKIREDDEKLLNELYECNCISEKTYLEYKNRMKK